jgi:integrase/recombinase XerD
VLIKLDAEIKETLKSYLAEERSKLPHDDSEPALFLNLRGQRLTRQGLWLIVKKRGKEVGLESEISPRTLRRSVSGKEELKAP